MAFGMNKILICLYRGGDGSVRRVLQAPELRFHAHLRPEQRVWCPSFRYNYGAGKPERFRRTIRLSAVTAIAIMCVGSCRSSRSSPVRCCSLFSPSEEMLAIGSDRAAHHRPDLPARGLLHRRGLASFRRIGTPFYSLIVSVCRQIVRAAAGGVAALPDRTAGAGVVVVPHRRAREPDALGHLPAQDAARGRRTPEPKIKNRRRRPMDGVSLLHSALTAPDRGCSDRW